MGLPLRRSSLSMQGRSSWIRDMVWIISTAQAAGMAEASLNRLINRYTNESS
ncbi:hypothetical protein Scep_014496 [Stephania cephalantha]|uniref:Uncharacterized protein n=1 Tax=Stephania cephalantha TaxID=152367 RepID=A0AAP0P1R9_9MAGN